MLIFCIKDPEGEYTPDQIACLMEKAEQQGHPMDENSYLQHLTVKQVAKMMNGVFDA